MFIAFIVISVLIVIIVGINFLGFHLSHAKSVECTTRFGGGGVSLGIKIKLAAHASGA